jgi:hypothetical protein
MAVGAKWRDVQAFLPQRPLMQCLKLAGMQAEAALPVVIAILRRVRRMHAKLTQALVEHNVQAGRQAGKQGPSRQQQAIPLPRI